ncbi:MULTISPECIES: hypothetical protein [Streptomyces]|uniref:hypothetical protein n=1 Tax=Streptomyces lycopersici TaxID=2974589 RepID=UPI0021CF20E8|nr:hypothetical protein [Streptomyces sp. NEAU-383]
MNSASTQSAGTHEVGKLWGGRFASASSSALENLSRSPAEYFRMVRYDAIGSKAHAGELARAGILTSVEHDRIVAVLDDLVL